jgi:hypothetical protein
MSDGKGREKERSPEEGRTAAAGVHAGETGVLYDEIGRIVMSRASVHGIDAGLWERLRVAVDQLRLVVDVNPLDAVHGRAAAIAAVGPEAGVWHAATVANPDAIRLAEYLRVHGFRAGEDGPGPTLRFGPPHMALNPTACDHADHLYVALPRRCRSGAVSDAEHVAATPGEAAPPARSPPAAGVAHGS